MIKGKELNTPKAVMSKFLMATSKLWPKSGVTLLSNMQINTIANTM